MAHVPRTAGVTDPLRVWVIVMSVHAPQAYDSTVQHSLCWLARLTLYRLFLPWLCQRGSQHFKVIPLRVSCTGPWSSQQTIFLVQKVTVNMMMRFPAPTDAEKCKCCEITHCHTCTYCVCDTLQDVEQCRRVPLPSQQPRASPKQELSNTNLLSICGLCSIRILCSRLYAVPACQLYPPAASL